MRVFDRRYGAGSSPFDADGIALAAIRGFNQLVEEKVAKIEALKKPLDRLEAALWERK